MRQNPIISAPVIVSFGAIAGALCRFYLGQWLAQTLGAEFPWGTFGINLSGCFCMGFVATLGLYRWLISPERLLLLTTGFLGSYTTFSAYELEVANLLAEATVKTAFLYSVGSPVLGLGCLLMGSFLARAIFSAKPAN